MKTHKIRLILVAGPCLFGAGVVRDIGRAELVSAGVGSREINVGFDPCWKDDIGHVVFNHDGSLFACAGSHAFEGKDWV